MESNPSNDSLVESDAVLSEAISATEQQVVDDDPVRQSTHSKQICIIPIACVFEPEKNMFRVTRIRGSTLQSGGYGVLLPSERTSADIIAEADSTVEDTATEKAIAINHTYLFIEEVIVLYKLGLLEARDEHGIVLDMNRLYDSLSSYGISFPVFLVYAHLRQQSYRVIRHTPTRRSILQDMEPYVSKGKNNPQLHELKRQLRLDSARAPAPQIAGSNNSMIPAFDVYMPNARFAKSSPGLPDFSVAVTHYQHSQVPFSQWHGLVTCSEPTPIKIAAVSDSGTVLILGVTNSGVPTMAN